MTVDLRRATPDDAEAIVRFWHESGASMSPGDSVGNVARAIANPAARLMLAETDRLVVHPSRWATAFWTAVGYPLDTRIVRHVGEPGAGWGAQGPGG